MLDYVDYTIDDNGYQGNGNGANPLSYDQLDGDWALFYKVAKGFIRRVRPEDRQDFLHDLLLAMARVKASYNDKGKELTEGGLVRITQYEVADYWRKWYKRINGIDCSNCSKAQRAKCKKDNLYRECPKAIKLDSLNRIVEGSDGSKVELHELIADDKAVDLAYKKYAGYPLNNTEKQYYYRQVKKAQKKLLKV